MYELRALNRLHIEFATCPQLPWHLKLFLCKAPNLALSLLVDLWIEFWNVRTAVRIRKRYRSCTVAELSKSKLIYVKCERLYSWESCKRCQRYWKECDKSHPSPRAQQTANRRAMSATYERDRITLRQVVPSGEILPSNVISQPSLGLTSIQPSRQRWKNTFEEYLDHRFSRMWDNGTVFEGNDPDLQAVPQAFREKFVTIFQTSRQMAENGVRITKDFS